MKNILLSSSLILVMALSGCDDDKPATDNLATTSVDKFEKQTVDLNVVENATEVATLSTTGVSLKIAGGSDADFFTLNGSKLLFKKGQNYIDGENNSFNVEISATDDAHLKKGKLLIITVHLLKSGAVIVTQDTTAPIFSTPTQLSMVAGTTTTIAAADSSAPITYSLTTMGSGFTLNGTTLTAPDTATPVGTPTNLTITATDSAQTPNTATLNMAVTVTNPSATGVQFSAVEDNRVTWDEANSACNAMVPAGTWELPTIEQYRANSDDLLAAITVDSDGDSSTGTHFTSVLWSSTDANVSTSKMGWGYFMTPADGSAQDKNLSYFYTCIKK